MSRCYSELIKLSTFEERLAYLSLKGSVGSETFGHDRYINQNFYRSTEWRNIRNFVLVRDNGCDLGVSGYDYGSDLLVHHMESMKPDDILQHVDWILDPEYLITCTIDTHNAIHFGGSPTSHLPLVRTPGDTKLWER